jgi:molecular chaperone HtpG
MDYSPQLERLLMKGKGGGPKQRRIMELNPKHELFKRMLDRHKAGGEEEAIGEQAELLWYYALLAEGSEISDPVRFSSLLAKLMTGSL